MHSATAELTQKLSWVGSGQSADWLGRIGSHKMDPWTTLSDKSHDLTQCRPRRQSSPHRASPTNARYYYNAGTVADNTTNWQHRYTTYKPSCCLPRNVHGFYNDICSQPVFTLQLPTHLHGEKLSTLLQPFISAVNPLS